MARQGRAKPIIYSQKRDCITAALEVAHVPDISDYFTLGSLPSKSRKDGEAAKALFGR